MVDTLATSSVGDEVEDAAEDGAVTAAETEVVIATETLETADGIATSSVTAETTTTETTGVERESEIAIGATAEKTFAQGDPRQAEADRRPRHYASSETASLVLW